MIQSMWHTSGSNAAHIRELAVLFGLLLSAFSSLFWASPFSRSGGAAGGFQQEPLEGSHHPSAVTEAKLRAAVGIATGITVLILFGLTIVSVSVGKIVSASVAPAGSLTIEVTGTQWWWKVRYASENPSRILQTADEIHIPVGQPIAIRGNSIDVIHSFWAPSLQGKRDLDPGRITLEWLQADRPGEYRGQCAEFCGLQHAHMAFWVMAEPPDRFNTWMDRQLQPAAEPSDGTNQKWSGDISKERLRSLPCDPGNRRRRRRPVLT